MSGSIITGEPRDLGSGRCTTRGYYVEARSTHGARRWGDFVLGSEWQRIETHEARGGTPNPIHDPLAAERKLMTFAAAHSIAAEVVAGKDFGLSIEVRLVQISLEYNWAMKEIGVSDPMDYWKIERETQFTARSGDPGESTQ